MLNMILEYFGGLKIGGMNRIYFSGQFIEESIFSPFTVGCGIKFRDPEVHFWLGSILRTRNFEKRFYQFDDKENCLAVRLEGVVFKKFLIRIMGNSNTGSKKYDFRIGIGFIKN